MRRCTNLMAAAAACMCCQLLPPSCAMCSVCFDRGGSQLARSPCPLFTAPACEYCRTAGVGAREATYYPVSPVSSSAVTTY